MINMIVLDYQSRTPIYEQIINEIERYVALGIIKPKEQIASIREMASNLGINPNTVKKAYTELESKGIIYTISTKGTFISDDNKKAIKNKVDSYYKEIEKNILELERLGVKRVEVIEKLKK